MKKIIASVLAVALVSVLVPVSFVMADEGPAESDIVSIDKSFDVESAGLCDHVTGEIVIETRDYVDGTVDGNLDIGVIVMDEMPEGLALIDVSVTPSVDVEDLVWDENSLMVTFDTADEYTIEFEVQVTDVLSYESIIVENIAIATDAAGTAVWASDELELEAYDGFNKTLEDAWDGDGVPVNHEEVPLNTEVHFLMYVDGDNNLDIDMLDAYIKDNLGGDIMLEYWDDGDGTNDDLDIRLTGKTEKVHLMLEIGDIASGEGFWSDLLVSTDINTGTGKGKKPGHQEYTSVGEHELNSGSTLKFTASDTGFTCSVESAPITVEVVGTELD